MPACRLTSRSRLTDADRGQRLAAKAQNGDLLQLLVDELGGGVALERQRQLLRRHAAAVVGDLDQRLAAGLQRHLDPAGAGVDRVLDQLLDHRGRSLDHLAGGDAVGHGLGQAADRGHRPVLAGGRSEVEARSLPEGPAAWSGSSRRGLIPSATRADQGRIRS